MDEIGDLSVLDGLIHGNQGISAVEKLLNEFEAHEANEEKSVEEYRKPLADMKDPATRLIMQMIVSDEASGGDTRDGRDPQEQSEWTKPAASLEGAPDDTELNRKLSAVTEEFIELEKAGFKEYKRLLEGKLGYFHGLFQILIDSMIRDSEKNVEMLEFLSRRLRTE